MASGHEDRMDRTGVLAEALESILAGNDLLVLGLPRGGIPIADGVARTLQAPLDVLVVRQLEVPGVPDLVLGALAAGRVREMNPEVTRVIPAELLERLEERGWGQLEKNERQYRNTRRRPRVRGKQVVLVDDRIGDGTMMRAAIRAARKRGAAKVIVAAPVASRQAIAEIEPMADAVVCPLRYEDLRSDDRWTPRSSGDPQNGHII